MCWPTLKQHWFEASYPRGGGGGQTLRDVAGPPRPSLASYGDKSGLGRIQPVMKTPYARVDVPT